MTSGRFQLDEDNENDRSTNTANSSMTATSATTALGATSFGNNNSNNVIGATEHLRKFVFTSVRCEIELQDRNISRNTGIVEKLEIKIPELLLGGYSFYTWPCAPILAWFLWERKNSLVGKHILELGAGTALPGILAAKCGAHVVLTDNCILPKSLAHIRKCCTVNNLVPGEDIEVTGLSWGLLLNSVFNLGNFDVIIAADCFYDPSVFEDVIVSVSFLLDRNPSAKFIFTYQERSADWSIEALLKKWKLCAVQILIDDIGKSSGVDLLELMGGHTIHLLEVSRYN